MPWFCSAIKRIMLCMAPNNPPQKSIDKTPLNLMCVACRITTTVLTILGLGAELVSYGTGIMINFFTFRGIAAGEVCGLCACSDFYCGSTYLCIICNISTYFMWSTYVPCLFDNIEGHVLYYLHILRTNVLAGHCWRVCKLENMFIKCGHPYCSYIALLWIIVQHPVA